jgi:LmbE family N-acetylglucosaminyl deacetylase
MFRPKLFLVALLALLLPRTGAAQESDTTGGIPTGAEAQPDTPVEEWSGKTILVTGAHPDDDSYAYGTLSRLQDNGNEIYVLIMTTGNVGTKDPDMSRDRLSQIRREEELEALSVLGIPEDHYINLGYTDGMLEFADEKDLVKRLVRHIREIQPDVLFSFDPGFGYQVWHKTDHRAAAYRSTDAARAAEWRLLFPGQINHDGLEAHRIEEYMLYGGPDEAQNVTVDIGGEHAENKVQAVSKHMSQFSSAWRDYQPQLPPQERAEYMKSIRDRVLDDTEDGVPVERFHYYEGLPDGIGKKRGGY